MKILTIDINAYCNIGCEFCYQDLDGSQLSENHIYDIVDKNPGFDTVEIGGGEPLLDKRIINIIKRIRENGKKLNISTNTTKIPEGLLDLEDKIRNNTEIQVSLHASNPELYQRITGKDLFNVVIENIGKLKPRYSTLISSAIYKTNFDDVPNIVELANQLELPIRINLVYPVGNGKNVDLLTQNQINQLRSYLLLEKIKQGNMIDSPLIHVNNCIILQNAYDIEKKNKCPLDLGKKYVSPRGEKYNCEFVRG